MSCLTGSVRCGVGRRVVLCLLAAGIVVGDGLARGDEGAAPVEPVVVLRIASLDRLQADLDQLLEAGGVPQYRQIVQGFLVGLDSLRGLDRSLPFGAMLFLPGEGQRPEPIPVLYVPVTSLEELRNTLALTGNALELSDSPEGHRLRLGQDELRLIPLGDYAVIVDPRRPAPKISGPRLAELLAELPGEADLSVRLRGAGFTAAQRARAHSQLEADHERDRQRRDGEDEAEFELRREVQDRVKTVIEAVLSDFEAATLAIHLPEPPGPLAIDVVIQLARDSRLKRWCDETLIPPDGRFQPVHTASAALAWRHSLMLSPVVRDLAARVVAHGRRKLEHGYDVNVPAGLRRNIDQLFEALLATIEAGRFEGLLEFVPTPEQKFVMVAAVGIERAESVEAALHDMLPLAREAPDVRAIAADAFQTPGLTFHRVEPRHVRARDALLYGEDLALHLAAGRRGLWLAIGGSATDEALQQVLGAPAANAAQPLAPPEAAPPGMGTAAPISLELHLHPWLQLASQQAPARINRPMQLALDSLSPPGADAVTGELRTLPEGLQVRVTLARGYVNLLARLGVEGAQRRRGH